jgi:NADH-quinone oxidoreductase subunit L
MYQAIVFLPLLGFILAAAISIVGARARFPGAEPSDDDHHHHHAAAHAAHETHIHAADAHHDDHHAPAEPAAAGSRAAEVITTSFLMISCVLSWIVFWKIGFGHTSERVTLFTWMISADLKVDWALRIDALTAVMLVVVTTVSGLVHLYSIGYMQEDPYRPRFFAYLSLFTFAMLALVTSDNLAQLFFGWEGVGLASYLLIGFWYHKPEANAAAIKAFVVNRVGDFGFAPCS